MTEKEQPNVIMEVTVIQGDKRKTYKVIHEGIETLKPLIAFFYNNILELSRGRKCLYYYHERRHESIELLGRNYEPVGDFYELEGLVIDFEKGKVYEFLGVDEGYYGGHDGRAYKIYHKNFTAIVYYSPHYTINPVKALFIRKARKI